MKSPSELLQHLITSDEGLSRIEQYLDEHPFRVGDEEVREISHRLERRLGRPPRVGLALSLGGLSFVLGAAALLGARTALVTGPIETTEPTTTLHPAFLPSPPAITPVAQGEASTPKRTITLAPGARSLSALGEGASVILMVEGRAETGETTIPQGHWALLSDRPTAEPLVFPDGAAHPRLDESWDRREVDTLLEKVRWNAMPVETQQTLERLLEK